jgi:cytochrome c oxidase cbb3-type subunit 3
MAEPAGEVPPELLSALGNLGGVTVPKVRTGRGGLSPEKMRATGTLFQMNCLACHGPDGKGNLMRAAMPAIPDFTARSWQTGKDSAQLAASVLDGKGTLMPPWRGRLTSDQARDLAAFVRALGPADLLTAEAPVTEFGTHFRELKKKWTDLEQQARSLTTQ